MSGGGQGVLVSYISYITNICAAPRGMVSEPLLSEIAENLKTGTDLL